VAGNSKRKGAIKKTGKGNPTAGSGGRVRRGLEGRGPTPKAKDRPYHQAHKDAAKAERAKAKQGTRRRTASDAEWAAGRNSVVELLRGGVPVTAVYVAEGAERDNRLREAFKLAAEQGVKLLEVTRNEMDRMTAGAVHQGLAARLPSYEYAHADDLLDRATEAKEPALIVALDSVTDPRNLGAVVRSAAGFGAHGVLIPERRAARLPIAQTVNLTRQLKAYQEAGCMVVGLAADGDLSLPELVAPGGLAEGPLVVVVGSEGTGMGRLVAETCDQIVSIPMAGQLESLNAGVAASVALYAISQARLPG
jgi:23S rRNA (guanosine2251-2'-O)-methyltransferase